MNGRVIVKLLQGLIVSAIGPVIFLFPTRLAYAKTTDSKL